MVGDLDPATLEVNVALSIDLAALIWEERHNDIPVPLSLIREARAALLLEADLMLADREHYAANALADAVEAGDLDRDGNFIPWERYP